MNGLTGVLTKPTINENIIVELLTAVVMVVVVVVAIQAITGFKR